MRNQWTTQRPEAEAGQANRATYVTVREASARSGYSVKTLHRKRHEFLHTRVGRAIRIDAESFARWLSRRVHGSDSK